MPVEIEAKMKLDRGEVERVRAHLRESGAVLLGEVMEQNTFLDTQDRALLAGDEGLRVRTCTDVNTGVARTVVTHKGPNRPGQLKMREETEVEVASATGVVALLEKLGYFSQLSFQKRRQSWKLDECRVEMDEVPHLGQFIEIEGPGEEAVMRVRERLGLAGLPLIKTSYIAMLARYLQERGDTSTEITFPQAPATKAAR